MFYPRSRGTIHDVSFFGQGLNASCFFPWSSEKCNVVFPQSKANQDQKAFFFLCQGQNTFWFFSQSRAKCIMFFSSVKGKMRYDFFSQSRGKCHMFYLGREENTSSFFLGQENNAIVK